MNVSMSCEMESNRSEAERDLSTKRRRAMTAVGMELEKWAKALCVVGTEESTGIRGYRGGTLRNSITFTSDESSVTLGTNVHYAPYVELGTGQHFEQPPEWVTNNAPRGAGLVSGMAPKPFLRPAILNHTGDIQEIIQRYLSE